MTLAMVGVPQVEALLFRYKHPHCLPCVTCCQPSPLTSLDPHAVWMKSQPSIPVSK